MFTSVRLYNGCVDSVREGVLTVRVRASVRMRECVDSV